MSRDMKPRKRQPAKKKSAGGTLIGMFIGLVLGVVIAASVVWYMNKSPLPFNKSVQAPARQDGSGPVNGKPAATPDGQPLALPGKPGDAIPEKRFQFYDILPGKADAVPDKTGKAVVAKEEPKKDEKKEDKKDEKKDAKKRSPRRARRRSSCRRVPSARRRMPTTRRPSSPSWGSRRSSSR